MLVRDSDLPTCPLPALPARGQQPGLCPGPVSGSAVHSLPVRRSRSFPNVTRV